MRHKSLSEFVIELRICRLGKGENAIPGVSYMRVHFYIHIAGIKFYNLVGILRRLEHELNPKFDA